jgi:hypothetical protein
MMTKKICVLLAMCLGWGAMVWADEAVGPKTHPDSTGWQDLFAADLSNAIYPKGVWYVQDGLLTATEDQCIWSKEQYSNFIIDLEFKLAPGSNSGVFVYGSDLKDWISNSVEIQILDDPDPKWANVAPTWRCAGIFGRLAPTKSAVKKPGEWNRMTITCKGPMIAVLLNGEAVTQIDMRKWTSVKKNPDGSDIPAWYTKPLANIATVGHIGLQGKHGGVPIYFRNIKVKNLAP